MKKKNNTKEDDINEYYKTFTTKNVKNKKSVENELVKQLFTKKAEKDKPKLQPTEKNNIHQCDLLYLPTDKGYSYLLVVVDVGSRLTDAEKLKSRNSTAIVNALEKIYKRKILSKPQKIRCDMGVEFKGEFSKYCKENNIYVSRSAVNRHRQTGLVESRNKSIGDYLLKRMVAQELRTGEPSTEWVDYYQDFINTINKENEIKKPYKFVEKEPVCNGNACVLLEEGDMVRYKLDRPIDVASGKPIDKVFRSADVRYSIKPVKIEMVILNGSNPPMYKLEGLQPWYTKEQLLLANEGRLPPDSTQSKFTVDKILKKEKRQNKIYYLVKWKGYDDSHNTYEPRTTLMEDVPEMVKEFDKSK
jgi:hypothetical protein